MAMQGNYVDKYMYAYIRTYSVRMYAYNDIT